MSSILGPSHPADSSTEDVSSPRTAEGSQSKRLSAVHLSGLVPGTGQFMLGHVRAGALFLAGFIAVIALFWPLRLPQWYLPFCVAALLLGAVSIAAAWRGARCAHGTYPKLSAPWLLLILPLAYLASSIDGNLVMRLSGFQAFNIPTSAMANTLMIGDRVVVDRSYYHKHTPRVGDVAVFRRGKIWEVKRVIAVGRDTIYGRAARVYRNGNLLYEPYVQHTGELPPQMQMNDFGPITLSDGQLFVMGDNRDVSYDSRQPEHGPIYLSAESGKPLYIIWSPERRRIGKSVR